MTEFCNNKLYIFLFILFNPVYLLAQNFGGTDSKWVFDYDGAWNYGITEVYFEKDTVIDDLLFNKFSKRATRIDEGDTIKYSLDPVFISNYNGVVVYSEDGILKDTLFDFTKKIGESWEITQFVFPYHSTIITVLDTFYVNISGHSILAQSAHFNHGPNSEFVDTIYEYIGAKYLYILPFDYYAVGTDGGEGGIVRCFENDLLGTVYLENSTFGIYELYSPYEYECEGVSSQTNVNDQIHITMYPNPFNENLFLEFADHSPRLISIYTSLGQLVFQHYSVNEETVINPDLHSGVYILLIQGNDRILNSQIIVRME